MGRKKSDHTLSANFRDKHDPIAMDLRTPKYRKRIEKNRKTESKLKPDKNFDLD